MRTASVTSRSLLHVCITLIWVVGRLPISADAGDNCPGPNGLAYKVHRKDRGGTICCVSLTCYPGQEAVPCKQRHTQASCRACKDGWEQNEEFDSAHNLKCRQIQTCRIGMYMEGGRCRCNTSAGYYPAAVEGHCRRMSCPAGKELSVSGTNATCVPCRENHFKSLGSYEMCRPFSVQGPCSDGYQFIPGSPISDSQCQHQGDLPPLSTSLQPTPPNPTKHPPDVKTPATTVKDVPSSSDDPPVDEHVKMDELSQTKKYVFYSVIAITIIIILMIAVAVVIYLICCKSGDKRKCRGLSNTCSMCTCCGVVREDPESLSHYSQSRVVSNVYKEQTASLITPSATKRQFSITRSNHGPQEHNDETGSVNGSVGPYEGTSPGDWYHGASNSLPRHAAYHVTNPQRGGSYVYQPNSPTSNPMQINSPESGVADLLLSSHRVPSEHSLISSQSEDDSSPETRPSGHRDSGVHIEAEHLIQSVGQGQSEAEVKADSEDADTDDLPPPYAPSDPNTPSPTSEVSTPIIIFTNNLQVANQIHNSPSPGSALPPFTSLTPSTLPSTNSTFSCPVIHGGVEEEADTVVKQV